MPQFIPIIAAGIAGALASAGVITSIGALVTAISVISSVLSALIPIAISVGLSAISKALLGGGKGKGNSAVQSFRDRMLTVRQPLEVRRIIYGELRVSGVITFLQSTNNNQWLNMLLTLSGHELEDLGAVYMNDELVHLDADGLAQGKWAGHLIVKKGLGSTAGDADLLTYMQNNTDGVWTVNHKQEGCGKIFIRAKFNSDIFPNGLPNVSVVAKGKKVFDPRSGLTEYSTNPALCLRDYFTNTTYGVGDSSINDTALNAAANVCEEGVAVADRSSTFVVHKVEAPANAPAVNGHWHNGVTRGYGTPQTNYWPNTAGATFKYAYTNVDETGESIGSPVTDVVVIGAFQWGVPVTQIRVGEIGTTQRKIYRSEANGSTLKLLATLDDNTTTVYHDLIADGSLGATMPTSSTTLIHDDVELPEENELETLHTGLEVVLSTTGTLPSPLSAGSYWAIRTEFETFKLATSKANALAGTFVDITDEGTGVHTMVLSEELRYTCNGIIDTDAKPKDVIEAMLTSMMGDALYQGGEWNIYPAAWRAPTVTLTDDDLDGGIEVATRLSRSEIFNGVKGVFSNPLDFFQPTDFPPVTNATYLAEDQGERIWQDTELSYTTSGSMAQRLAKIELERVRQQITLTLHCKLSACQLQAGDVFKFTHDRYGWSEKTFLIIEWKLAIREGQDGVPRIGVDLLCRETASGVFDWNVGEETMVDLSPNTSLPDPFVVQPAGSPMITEVVYATTNSAGVKSKATVSWAASIDGFVERYELQCKRAEDIEWHIVADIRGLSVDLFDLDTGFYDFKVTAYNARGVASAETDIVREEIVGLSAPPDALTNFTLINSAGFALANWDLSVDLDVQINGTVVIRHTPLTSGANWEDGLIIGTFEGGSTQALLPLMEGTYMAKARDSTGNWSTSMVSFVSTEGLLTGFTTVATLSEHTSFTGTKTNLTATASVLRLTDPSSDLTGEYEFSAVDDRTTKAVRRYEADINVLCYVQDDTIDDRIEKTLMTGRILMEMELMVVMPLYIFQSRMMIQQDLRHGAHGCHSWWESSIAGLQNSN